MKTAQSEKSLVSLLGALACCASLFVSPIVSAQDKPTDQVEVTTPSPAQSLVASDESKPSTGSEVVAQPSPSPSTNQKQKTDEPKAKAKKRGEFVIAPIPISSPAIGSGLIGVLGYVFQVDKNDTTSSPSVVGLAFMRTNNGSLAGGLLASMHFK